MRLSERGAAETLYAAYHQILGDKDRPYWLPDQEDEYEIMWRPKRLLADLVEKNQIQHRYIKKFLGRAEAEKLLKNLHSIYEDSERRREALSETTEPIDGK